VSLSVAFLKDYFAARPGTQGEFAETAGIDPSLLSKLFVGQVSISAKNLPRLLAGLPTEGDKLRFLTAYLRDQIPTEHAHQVEIRVAGGPRPSVGEPEAELLAVLALLPPKTRRDLALFARALREDAHLRTVFNNLLRYIPGTGE
jgi:transcriptional regulator with XRE-family HTH domain